MHGVSEIMNKEYILVLSLAFSACVPICSGQVNTHLMYPQNAPPGTKTSIIEGGVYNLSMLLTVPITVYGREYGKIWPTKVGVISLNGSWPWNWWYIQPFENIADDYATIIIHWNDHFASWYVYETNDEVLRKRARRDIQKKFQCAKDVNFMPDALIVHTIKNSIFWSPRGYYDYDNCEKEYYGDGPYDYTIGDCPPLILKDTFQVVIATGNKQTYVMFNYVDIEWAYSPAGGDTGAGFTSGDGRYYTLPWSPSGYKEDMQFGTNINMRGRYIFRVDGPNILQPEDCT